MDEDCLYLNVWTPAAGSAEDRLPVMVWIHGGSFETGAGSMAVYDGTLSGGRRVWWWSPSTTGWARSGFLAHPALSAESAEGSSGNYGLLDQIAALEWVQRNIAAFGGDPGNVTVFGESAGAISILDLLVSPLGRGPLPTGHRRERHPARSGLRGLHHGHHGGGRGGRARTSSTGWASARTRRRRRPDAGEDARTSCWPPRVPPRPA